MPLHQTLLRWYDKSKREFAFRGTGDPYRIWLSEIMLQQTRTETVVPYFERFTKAFPTVEALAKAEEDEVLLLWQGLGYYSRARNLHAAAKKVWFELGGQFPKTPDGLLKLPGVGPYTAAAIASIAFDYPAPAMDGNLTRVFSRIHGVRDNVDTPSVKRHLEEIAKGEMPKARCGDFNQALMDLGATVCTPGTPDCHLCPVKKYCNAYREGDADMLPVKSVKKPPKEQDFALLLITQGDRILLTQRKENLLKNLWVFPMLEDAAEKDILAHLPPVKNASPKYLGSGKHVFTHLIWQMKIYHLKVDASFEYPNGQWVRADEMDNLPIPTAMRAALEHARRLSV